MPDLTLTQRFGNGVSFNSSNKSLTIDLSDLSSIQINGVDYGLDTSNMSEANKDEYASKVLWALLLKSQSQQPTDNTDETVSIYVTNQGKRAVARNQVAQFGFQLLATAYKTDTVGQNLDPDDIGA